MGIHYGSRPSGNSGIALDLAFPQNTLLLKTNEVNGAQNNTFVDSSTNNFTITRNGTPTQGSFSPYGDLWSNQFSGSGQYLSVPDNAALDFGSGDFTIESWICPTAYNSESATIVSKDYGNAAPYQPTWRAFLFQLGASGGVYNTLNIIIFNSTTLQTFQTTGITFAIGAWYHVAAVRSGNTMSLYVNGTLYGSGTITIGAINDTAYPVYVGVHGYSIPIGSGALGYFPGYISNLRIVKGTALYTSNFTPSTTPLTAVSGTSLLTCQSSYFKDNSSNNFTSSIVVSGAPEVSRFSPFNPASSYSSTLYGGSGYFNGTSDSLTINTADALNISSGDFTVECWFNTSNSNTGIIFALTNGTTITDYTQASIAFGVWSTGNFAANIFIGNTFTSVGVSSMSRLKNQWVHVALTRSGNLFTCYLGGVSIGTYSTSSALNYNSAWKWGIGSAAGSTQYGYHKGYIADVRITKGSVLYSGSFNPPTTPLPAVGGTGLLTSFTAAGIYDAATLNDLVTVGDAQVSTSVKKYGTGSIAFDGSGDYLTSVDTPNFELGTGDFTMECWANFSASVSGVTYGLVAQGTAAFTSNAGFFFLRHDSNKLRFIYTSDGTGVAGYRITDSTANFLPTTGVWYHLAVTRSGSTFRLFIDGVQVGSSTQTTAIFNSTLALSIGADANGSAAFNGYIDDLRITKGYARYTANFTPPTAPFPTKKVGY